MKKIITLLFVGLLMAAAPVQAQIASKVVPMVSSYAFTASTDTAYADTLTNGGTAEAYLEIKGTYKYATIQIDVQKVSGTINAGAFLQASNNGKYWTTIQAADSMNCTNQDMNTTFYDIDLTNKANYYRVLLDGYGTQVAYLRAMILPTKEN